ncbi:CP family cyanate transporter-like MFS transporter [Mycetocola sp. CAN_C7]|uniref:MFS transporter n=1 Tax=Mycetocola sp. CAN_C7 TaxID=2787724 RepID=UPI0018CB523E
MNAALERPLLAGRFLAFVGIILVAANLRAAVSALSPILGRVSDEIPLSPLAIGVVGALPPICFAVFGIVTPMLVRRARLEPVLVVALVAILAGHLLRSAAGNVSLLLLGSAVAFAGLGVGNVLLPPLVKKYFPDRIALVTTLYVTMMSVSAFIPPLVVVPVADAAGWRVSLGMWAVVSFVAIIPWVSALVRGRRNGDTPHVEEARSDVVRRLWRSPLAWALASVFGLSSMSAYAMFAWLPPMLQDIAGVDEATAGALLSVFALMGFPAGLLIPIVASRMKNVAWLVYLAVALFVGGYAGLLLIPSTFTIVWVALIGLGPLLFPLALVLINLRTRTHDGAIALSGFVQSVGYLIGALGPLTVGIVHDLSGGWTLPIVILAVLALAVTAAGPVLARSGKLEDGA